MAFFESKLSVYYTKRMTLALGIEGFEDLVNLLEWAEEPAEQAERFCKICDDQYKK